MGDRRLPYFFPGGRRQHVAPLRWLALLLGQSLTLACFALHPARRAAPPTPPVCVRVRVWCGVVQGHIYEEIDNNRIDLEATRFGLSMNAERTAGMKSGTVDPKVKEDYEELIGEIDELKGDLQTLELQFDGIDKKKREIQEFVETVREGLRLRDCVPVCLCACARQRGRGAPTQRMCACGWCWQQARARARPCCRAEASCTRRRRLPTDRTCVWLCAFVVIVRRCSCAHCDPWRSSHDRRERA